MTRLYETPAFQALVFFKTPQPASLQVVVGPRAGQHQHQHQYHPMGYIYPGSTIIGIDCFNLVHPLPASLPLSVGRRCRLTPPIRLTPCVESTHGCQLLQSTALFEVLVFQMSTCCTIPCTSELSNGDDDVITTGAPRSNAHTVGRRRCRLTSC